MFVLDINNAGQKLSAIDLAFKLDKFCIDVNWFRAYESIDVPIDNWHYHSDLEIHFIFKGCVHFLLEADLVSVGKGEAIFIPAKCRHRLWNGTPEFSIRHVISFSLCSKSDDEDAQALIQALSFENYHCLAISEEMEALLYCCLHEAEQQNAWFKEKIQGYLISLIIELARATSCAETINCSTKEKTPYNQLRYRKAIAFMEMNLEKMLKVEEIAAHLSISTKQLQRIFRAESNRSVNQTLQDMRLKHAKLLLKDTTFSISQISQIMGFSSEQSFSRFFKRGEGQLPSDFRLAILPTDYQLTTPIYAETSAASF